MFRQGDAFITELYVRPTHRRTGIGAAALEECENLARQCGASALHLMARNDNAAALRLYEGAGFTTPPRRFFTKSL